jgi:hypothetical protein
MTTPSRADYPVEAGRPSLKWGRKISESLAGARLTSPDHMISEGPGGTCIKHKPIRKTASASTTLPFVNIFEQTTTTAGTWTPGKAYIGGVDTTVAGVPSTISGITTTTIYWIKHDFAASTLTWGSGASLPANTDTAEYYRMLVVTCADGVIESFVCPHPCDIHATAKST